MQRGALSWLCKQRSLPGIGWTGETFDQLWQKTIHRPKKKQRLHRHIRKINQRCQWPNANGDTERPSDKENEAKGFGLFLGGILLCSIQDETIDAV